MLGLMQGNTLCFCQHRCLLEPVKGFNLRLLFFFSAVSVESSTSSGLKSPRAADVAVSMTITEAEWDVESGSSEGTEYLACPFEVMIPVQIQQEQHQPRGAGGFPHSPCITGDFLIFICDQVRERPILSSVW